MSDSEKNYEVYHSQIETAGLLFDMFKKCFKGKKFRKLHVLITNPSNRKLNDQCKDNLKKFMEGYYLKDQKKTGKFSVSPNDFECEVIHSGQLVGEVVSKKVQAFFENAKAQKNELFLVIQDECHWGVREGSLLDKHIFSNDGCKEDNVFFVHVSATPYNMKPIINTDRCVKIKISEKYYGLSKCIEKGNLKKTQLQFSNKNGYFESFVQSYLDALDRYHGLQEKNEEVKEKNEIYEYVEEMISNKKMILVRLPKKSEKYKIGKSSPIDYFYSNLLYKLKLLNKSKFKIEFEIIKDDGNNTEDDYSKWEDKACLVLVVQKGGLGINFPKSLILQDLRMRYTSKFYFSTFYQDIGRSFGYKKSPSILISQNAYKTSFVNGRINWDALIYQNGNLKKEHFNKKEKPFSDEINDRNFLLDAEPQVGKTGCFFWLIKLLHDNIQKEGNNEQEQVNIEKEQRAEKGTKKRYTPTEFAELNKDLETISISERNKYFLENHQDYMDAYDERSENWEKVEWKGQEILKHFAVILSNLEKKELTRIYDFGAGKGMLGAIVKQYKEWNPEWHSFDLVKDEENNVKECDHYGEFEMFKNLNEKPDCILFSFSLFGGNEENMEVIKKCSKFLAKGGKIFICSTKERDFDDLGEYSIQRKFFQRFKNGEGKELFNFSIYKKEEEE